MKKSSAHPAAQWIGQLSNSVFLLFALVIVSFLCVSKEASAQTAVTYGQEYYIKNSYAEGSYLDTCGGASCTTTTRFGVVTDSKPDRAGVGTGKWVLVSTTGKANGSNVQFGDVVHLRNLYGGGSYLDTCGGASCTTTTRFGVVTDSKPDRAGVGTGKWTIVSAAGKANGSNVLDADVVHLRNLYGGGSYLDTCGGASCTTTTRFGVVTDSKPDRAGAGTGKWTFVPVAAAAPPWNPVGNPAQSSTYPASPAALAVDGNTNGLHGGGSLAVTNTGDPHPWWYRDLGSNQTIQSIRIYGQTDACCTDRLSGAKVFISSAPFTTTDPVITQATPGVTTYTLDPGNHTQHTLTPNVNGRYLRIQHTSSRYLALAEVRVNFNTSADGGQQGGTYRLARQFDPSREGLHTRPNGTLVAIKYLGIERLVETTQATIQHTWYNRLTRIPTQGWYGVDRRLELTNVDAGNSGIMPSNTVFKITNSGSGDGYVRLESVVYSGYYLSRESIQPFTWRSVCSGLGAGHSIETIKETAYGARFFLSNDPRHLTWFKFEAHGVFWFYTPTPYHVSSPLMPIEYWWDCPGGDCTDECGTRVYEAPTAVSAERTNASPPFFAQYAPKPVLAGSQGWENPIEFKGRIAFWRWNDKWTQGQQYPAWATSSHQFFIVTQ